MAKHRLYVFSDPNGEREIVVISEEPYTKLREEYEDHGRRLDQALDIVGSATMFPCDRELKHSLS